MLSTVMANGKSIVKVKTVVSEAKAIPIKKIEKALLCPYLLRSPAFDQKPTLSSPKFGSLDKSLSILLIKEISNMTDEKVVMDNLLGESMVFVILTKGKGYKEFHATVTKKQILIKTSAVYGVKLSSKLTAKIFENILIFVNEGRIGKPLFDK